MINIDYIYIFWVYSQIFPLAFPVPILTNDSAFPPAAPSTIPKTPPGPLPFIT